ncbi:MAG: glycosyltransferase [Actinobacteria bacterium]|nr:glycosyltransferase [Actinomycetota bacterium]
MKIQICIPVYNEEKNIGYLLESLIKQQLKSVSIEDMVVVSSGSTDTTETIVQDYQAKDNRITLLRQNKREGKASAINAFLKNASNGGDIVMISSGDIVFEKHAVENLCKPFLNDNAGMTSVNPIPTGTNGSMAGFVGYMYWRLANVFERPGEAIAFRRYLVLELPVNTAVDEAWIEAAIHNKGYETVYVDNAIVYNKSPDTVSDFLKQRRRQYAGHLDLKSEQVTLFRPQDFQ